MTRTKQIRDNLKKLQEINKEYTILKFDIVKEENIKEAENMICMLESVLECPKLCSTCRELTYKEKKDWQNRLNWLRGLK